jgi:hypothetical protein
VDLSRIEECRLGIIQLIDVIPPGHPAKMYFEELDAALEDVVKRTTTF